MHKNTFLVYVQSFNVGCMATTLYCHILYCTVWKLIYFPITGTKVGDPEELSTLDEIFCTDRVGPLKIGSIKSNLGHSEAASGLCCLAKVRHTIFCQLCVIDSLAISFGAYLKIAAKFCITPSLCFVHNLEKTWI